MVLQDKLLGDGILVLPLLQGVKVDVGKVLIQVHLVVQVLEACYAGQGGARPALLGCQTHISEVAAVTAAIVVGNLPDLRDGFRRSGRAHNTTIFIRIATLVEPFMAGCEVETESGVGTQDESHASSEILLAVDEFVATGGIAEIAAIDIAEEVGAEGKTVAYAMIVSESEASAISIIGCRTAAKSDISTLIGKRILGKDADDATHRVAPVKRALRTTQHINAVNVAEVEVVAGS